MASGPLYVSCSNFRYCVSLMDSNAKRYIINQDIEADMYAQCTGIRNVFEATKAISCNISIEMPKKENKEMME